jgi:dimethylglycine dehydrogenase
MGYVEACIAPGSDIDIMVLGRPHRARILQAPPFDPEGARLRA